MFWVKLVPNLLPNIYICLLGIQYIFQMHLLWAVHVVCSAAELIEKLEDGTDEEF